MFVLRDKFKGKFLYHLNVLYQSGVLKVPISFYKIFGYPTGVGALIVRREVLARLRRSGRSRLPLRVTVIPGVSAPQVLAAAHRIPLNRTDGSVSFVSGPRLLKDFDPALGDVVVLNDTELACRGLVAEFPEIEVFWGAYLGTPDQVLANGPLGQVIDDLLRLREQLVAHHGWIQDTYLLRVQS